MSRKRAVGTEPWTVLLALPSYCVNLLELLAMCLGTWLKGSVTRYAGCGVAEPLPFPLSLCHPDLMRPTAVAITPEVGMSTSLTLWPVVMECRDYCKCLYGEMETDQTMYNFQ